VIFNFIKLEVFLLLLDDLPLFATANMSMIPCGRHKLSDFGGKTTAKSQTFKAQFDYEGRRLSGHTLTQHPFLMLHITRQAFQVMSENTT